MDNNYYGMEEQGNKEAAAVLPQQSKPSYPGIHDKKLIEMISAAVTTSEESAKVYKNLQNELVSESDKATARGIMLDNAKHCRQLGDIMRNITGSPLEAPAAPPAAPIIKGVRILLPGFFEDRFHTELTNVELFRQIYFSLIDLELRDILFEIITDKQRHALCMCLMHSKYK
jgi:rubrerythrin